MACAQTGSGKTAAFLIPTCSALFGQAQQLIARARPGDYHHFKARPLVLILAPTRELCCQIFDEARRVSSSLLMTFHTLSTHASIYSFVTEAC